MIREVTLAAALALTASMAHADEPPLYLKGVLIKSVERSRVGSGIFVFWHRWTVEPRAGDTMSLFSLSLSTEEPLPSPGQLCDVRYHLGKLGGMPGPAFDTAKDWPIVDDFTCAPLSQKPGPPSP
ncbi:MULTISPECIES: hypothetical protein [Caulobacter]|uniref:hypothetical protein n=1 Tax=Caulobacter TaxID=75 RepID=UPI0006F3950C|nr:MULTISPECIES: hypothetical protein [Caulobacter]KQZ27204.1 hypothetical protein ASD47_05690 [Caulobacter sp. Root1472]GGL34143.1 hypothetical protein GCM10010983_34050 [Caulobacter rhizosphaerae]